MAKLASRSPLSPFYPHILSEDSGLGFGDGMPSARPGQMGDGNVRAEAVYMGVDGSESIDAEDIQLVCIFKPLRCRHVRKLRNRELTTVHTAVGVMSAVNAQGERVPTAMSRDTPLP